MSLAQPPNSATHFHTTLITLFLTILPSPPPPAAGGMGEMAFSSAVHCRHTGILQTFSNNGRLRQVGKCSKSKDTTTVSAGSQGQVCAGAIPLPRRGADRNLEGGKGQGTDTKTPRQNHEEAAEGGRAQCTLLPLQDSYDSMSKTGAEIYR